MIAAENGRPTSPAPSSASSGRRRSLSNRLAALGAKLTQSLTKETETTETTAAGEDNYEAKDRVSPILPTIGIKERSQSRGRDAFSTGRGGLGNIRQTSASTSRTRPETGPDDFSDSRGREPKPNSSERIYSTGRGGAGNIRSPSRDPSKPPAPAPIDATEQDIIRTHIAASQLEPVSSGRGGLGNISSRSRSRGPALAANAVHSTGRGGAGNILTGDAGGVDTLDEAERKKLAAGHESAPYHSTGRGGLANLASGPEPGVEKVAHNPSGHGSTGRGGAGNIKHGN